MRLAEEPHDIFDDYRNYWSPGNLLDLAGGVALAAAMANTPLDQHFRDYYQADIRSPTTDNIANVTKYFGQGGSWSRP